MAEVRRAVLVGLRLKDCRRTDFLYSMDELAGLVHSAGVSPAARCVQERDSADPAYYIGRGKVDEIAAMCAGEGAEVVVVNDPLSPAQARNLQDRMSLKVIDRTQLILDIFAQRARTQEGKLQVELAQLTYMLPRLTGKGVELSRLGGGIGTRGPGEMKLEIDRRRIRERIHKLRMAIDRVRNSRALRRHRRQRQRIPTVAVVGYTNAGKSTLFERLARTRTLCSPKLFATLDPLCRLVRPRHARAFYLSDTVGFIRKLPVELVAAFRATLEEVVYADLLIHVCDLTSLDLDGDIRAVEKVLADLEVLHKPIIRAYNKVDLLAPRLDRSASGSAVNVSALTGQGIERLLEAVGRCLGRSDDSRAELHTEHSIVH